MEEKWIHDGINEAAISWAKNFGKGLSERNGKKGPLTTSQLRKFFGELKRIDTNRQKRLVDLPMLKPMLAYAVGRDKIGGGITKTQIDVFEEEISKGLSAIRNDSNKESDFKNFVKLFEAVVAYHKYYS